MAGAVFISYASQDAEAARRICEALRSGGVEVWFDQEGGLEHGDAWDAKIRTQIRECLLFIPIISANTQARHEGYFRVEWELAADRAMGIAQGVPFILPVAIDETREPGALVPDRFRKVQWTRMPAGVVSPEVRARLLKLWSHRAGVVSHEAERAGAPSGSAGPFPVEETVKARPKTPGLVAAAVAVGAAIAITLAAGAGWFFAGRTQSAPSIPAPAPPVPAAAAASAPTLPKSVAVLAFTSQGDDKENIYLSEGISEELLNALASVPGLKVAPRASSFFFKGKQVALSDMARQLGVAYVVQGSVDREGNRVRISSQLARASDGSQVWSDNFDRELKDIFGMKDEIAGLISKSLQLRMGDAAVAGKTVVDPVAFPLFLEGRAQVERASVADIKAGIVSLQQAVERAPNYAAAWARLARANIQLARLGGIEPGVGYDQARRAVAKAAALEPDSPEVLVALGWVRRTADWDWKGARQAFRRAVELKPENADTLADAAVLFFNTGQTEEGIKMATHAAELDPLNSSTQRNLSIFFQFAGEMNKAEQAARRALQLAPDGQRYHGSLATILVQQGRPLKAEEEIALETDDVARHAAIGFLSIFRDQRLKAEAQARQIEALAVDRRGSVDNYSFAAEIYASLGESDRAFEALGKSLDGRHPSCAWYKVDFYLGTLHGDPRWPALMSKIGLADDQLK
jgi:TolB-like protein/tetratricopeptide (TPR) repeat protein